MDHEGGALQGVVRAEDVEKTPQGEGYIGHTGRIMATCPTCHPRTTKPKGGTATKLQDIEAVSVSSQ